VACALLYMHLGVKRENMVLCDRSGVIYEGRKENMNPFKERFAVKTPYRTLADAMRGADAFCGVSSAELVTRDMVKSMAPRPIVFAMANPVPEINYHEAREARSDIIMATGRSDFPNQVNNVLGFPFIFRGALDVRARQINMEMKVAATKALAQQAKQEVPDRVLAAYGLKSLEFGPEYIIPKPFDPNVLFAVAPAVAEAATRTGVARKQLESLDAYIKELEKRARHIEGLRIPE
jgi:malate dehydrogenase (oxaloacetate-decarboxylating)(NADP+)